ncbi:MAG: L-2-amino-thiazoline-4-carboxylic acid hydrolase [Bacteroidales bacterium]|nr:L-2-amino-thiazoline-4-carboxylic acid hydrolase [Bacteroidales bacterium]
MEKELKTLQLFYASVLADSVFYYNNAGILNMVTEKKAKQQELTAASQLKQLHINSPEELFEFFSNVFGCIQWQTVTTKEGLAARGKHCLLCSIAKKMQTAQPCFIYCINPLRAMINALNNGHHLSVEKTLWDGDICEFKVARN